MTPPTQTHGREKAAAGGDIDDCGLRTRAPNRLCLEEEVFLKKKRWIGTPSFPC